MHQVGKQDYIVLRSTVNSTLKNVVECLRQHLTKTDTPRNDLPVLRLFNQTVRLKNLMSKRIFCFSASSGTLHKEPRKYYFCR